MEKRIWIGLDGGGTHTSAVAINSAGQIVAKAEGGALNFLSSSMQSSRAVLSRIIKQLRESTGAEFASVHVGTTALDDEADHQTLLSLCENIVPPESFTAISDLRAALFALTQGAPGVMLVCGTGLMTAAFTSDRKMKLCGGWGYALSDEGSCFFIGQQGLLAAVHDQEGRGERTVLRELACDFFGAESLRGIIPLLYPEGMVNERVASFARVVIEQAKKKEPASRRIIHRALEIQVSVCGQLIREAGLCQSRIPVGVYGGFFQHHNEHIELFRLALEERFPNASVRLLNIPPAVGAVLDGLERLRPEGWEGFQKRILSAWG